jgi:hypothetical protein
MGLYNIVNQASLVAGQPEDIGQVLANFQAIQAVLNGGIDDVNIRSTAAINPSKFLGYPSDRTKWLRGDGLWLYGVNTTVGTMAAGPPAGPADGDIWIATGVDANGTIWQFRYNAGSASAYKWEFIGGPSAEAERPSTVGITSTAWTEDATNQVRVTLARGGDYLVSWGIQRGGTGLANQIGYASVADVSIGPASVVVGAAAISGNGTNYQYSCSGTNRATAIPAGHILGEVFQVGAGVTMSAWNPWMTVTPVRIS